MIICSFCNHNNPDEVLMCVHCGHLLAILSDAPLTMDVPGEQIKALLPIPKIMALAENEIALYINNGNEPIIRQVSQQILIGRQNSTLDAAHLIDLVPYGGLRKGVSRAHAVIRRADKIWTLTDMGSSYGTFVNGAALSPYTLRTLTSQDMIRLGQIMIEFYGGPALSEKRA